VKVRLVKGTMSDLASLETEINKVLAETQGATISHWLQVKGERKEPVTLLAVMAFNGDANKLTGFRPKE
jgi:hypothetical protein